MHTSVLLNTQEIWNETTENWYSHIPESVTEHEGITVSWNQEVQKDMNVLKNRHDIMVKNK
jgi:hypothetical protein